ncbi:MAG: glycosyltransferase [Pseudolabrys sp.]
MAVIARNAVLSGKPPRALFLSFKLRYMNPTRQLFEHVLRAAFDTTFFGPGYCSLEEVAAGPQAFADARGPFDVVIADEYAMLRDAIPEDQKHLHKFYYQACDFDPLLIHEGTRYYRFLTAFEGPRIITLLTSDYYNFTPDFIDQLEEAGDYYLCWGPEFIPPKSAVAPAAVAGQPLNAAIYARWNDNYLQFLHRHHARVISTPHYVAAEETDAGRLERRRFMWSVLGADYEARVTARALIDGAGYRRSGKALPYLYAAAGKLGFHWYNKVWALDLINYLFRKAIRSACFGFTCGSALRWPIRKYVEIPANGAVLVAERCHGFEALGFKDGVNAVAAEASEVLDAHAALTRDMARAQSIADAGRDLVLRRHSVSARAEQLGRSVARICAGTFAGGRWSDGEFVLNDAGSGQAPAGARSSMPAGDRG